MYLLLRNVSKTCHDPTWCPNTNTARPRLSGFGCICHWGLRANHNFYPLEVLIPHGLGERAGSHVYPALRVSVSPHNPSKTEGSWVILLRRGYLQTTPHPP